MYLSHFNKIADNEWIHTDLMCCSQLSNFVEVNSLHILGSKRTKGISLLGEKAGSGRDKSCFYEALKNHKQTNVYL